MWVFTNITNIVMSNTINICHTSSLLIKNDPWRLARLPYLSAVFPTSLVVFNVSKVPFTPPRLAGFTAHATTHHGLPFRSLYYIKNSHHYQKLTKPLLLFAMTLSPYDAAADKRASKQSFECRAPRRSCEAYNVVKSITLWS